MSGEHGNGTTNGEPGVTHVKVPTLIITLDPGTLLVNLKCEGLAISVVQMMLDEVQRQLDIQRRQAAAMELQTKLAEARKTAALVESLSPQGTKFFGKG